MINPKHIQALKDNWYTRTIKLMDDSEIAFLEELKEKLCYFFDNFAPQRCFCGKESTEFVGSLRGKYLGEIDEEIKKLQSLNAEERKLNRLLLNYEVNLEASN